MKQYLTEKADEINYYMSRERTIKKIISYPAAFIVYVIKSIAQLIVNLSLMIMSAITLCVYFAVVVMIFTCKYIHELIKEIRICLA